MSDVFALGDSSVSMCCMKGMSPGKQADTQCSASWGNWDPRAAVHQCSQNYRWASLLSRLLSCSKQMENILNSRAGLLSKLLSCSRQMENILNSMAWRKLENILQLMVAAFGSVASNKGHRNPQPVLAHISQPQKTWVSCLFLFSITGKLNLGHLHSPLSLQQQLHT